MLNCPAVKFRLKTVALDQMIVNYYGAVVIYVLCQNLYHFSANFAANKCFLTQVQHLI